ncbi:MAG: class I poly(R)-hydroxyalkanoic acid synthase [Pseudomonadota bacterium]
MSTSHNDSAVHDSVTEETSTLLQSLAEVTQRSQVLWQDYLARKPHQTHPLFADDFGVQKAFMELTNKLLTNPYQLAEVQMHWWMDNVSLWQNLWLRFWGANPEPVAEPGKQDKRFRHEEWQKNFVFDYLKQSYLITAYWLNQAVEHVEGLSPETEKKVNFFTRQFIDAMSPTNFAITNPEVIEETLKTGGHNLIKGFTHLIEDLERGEGTLKISMTDPKAFELGKNVGTTPGDVVFQNEMMQLIQYRPSQEKIHQIPLLILPPWINKFYILDLREKNSLIKWAVDQGLNVFVVSWVNPTGEYANKNFEDYMLQGPLAALDVIENISGAKQLNAVGYCLGGTLLAATLAYLEEKKEQKRIASATFMTTLVDFSEPGDLGVFIDEEQIQALEAKMSITGTLEGKDMANTFNLLRPNDLIWSFVVNNYLLGREPFPFDLLFWNSDATRMPCAMHSFYLRKMYLENKLREPNGITLAGVPINLEHIATTPLYFISTLEDHIAPWKSTYKGAQLFKTPVRFVLGGSGHIAGMINPPAAKKYGYWTNNDPITANTPESWQANAVAHEGSWWTDWKEWVTPYLGKDVAAKAPGSKKFPPLEAAPGSYVKVR